MPPSEIINWAFLGSQRAFLPSKGSRHLHRMLSAGFRSGKSTVLCRAGILLSHLVPDNLGFIGRATGKDLETTLYETFFNEVCPPSLILDQKKVGQTGRNVIIKSVDPRRPSRIYMDYITDKSTGKSHIAGMNLGWFGISQAEEITRDDYHKLLGRLSRNVPQAYALGECNLQGHNWIYEDFYAGGDYQFTDPRTMFKVVQKENRIGVIARSEENRVSMGGFVRDEYFDELRRTYPPEWIARQLDGSFDDFSGQIYKGFNLDSVHNIEPFTIPPHWGWVVSIDPGGSDPNCLGVFRVDTEGNLIGTDEFYQPNVVPDVIINWLGATVPVKETRFVIDYENRLFTLQLQNQFGIICEPAMKDVYAGCQQAASYFYVNPNRKLPAWYADTQGQRYAAFSDKGSPRIFFFKPKMPNIRRDCNSYIWDERNPVKPKASPYDHGGDMARYLCNSSIQPVSRNADEQAEWTRQHDPLKHLLGDPASYHSAQTLQRRLASVQREQRNNNPDWSSDGIYSPSPQEIQQIISEFC